MFASCPLCQSHKQAARIASTGCYAPQHVVTSTLQQQGAVSRQQRAVAVTDDLIQVQLLKLAGGVLHAAGSTSGWVG